MNKIFIIFLMLFFFKSSFTQPILTAANINPVLGDQYRSYGTVDLADTLQTGMNITWDYSYLVPYDSVIMVANSTMGTNIPSASIRYSDLVFQTSNYYNTSPSSLEFAGLESAGHIMVYGNPEKLIKYPFQYNDTLVDFYSSYVIGMNQYRYGTVYSKADGYGTLKLPSGVFNNALRVKTNFHGRDSSNGIAVDVDLVMVRWYVPGIHIPVADAYLYPAAQATPHFQYIGAMPTDIKDYHYNNDINIYPNPTSTTMNIKISNRKFQSINKELYNSIGQLIMSTGENELHVSHLTGGVYYLKCGNAVRKIIID